MEAAAWPSLLAEKHRRKWGGTMWAEAPQAGAFGRKWVNGIFAQPFWSPLHFFYWHWGMRKDNLLLCSNRTLETSDFNIRQTVDSIEAVRETVYPEMGPLGDAVIARMFYVKGIKAQ